MIVDMTQECNDYFVAFLNVHDIKNGNEVELFEYSRWITAKYDKFRRLKKYKHYNAGRPEIQAEFKRFVLEKEYE